MNPSPLSHPSSCHTYVTQVLRTVRRFEYVRWPPMFTWLLEKIDIPLDLSLIPADCVAGRTLSFYERLGAILLLPFASWLASLFLATTAWLYRRCHGGPRRPLRVLYNSSLMWSLMIWMILCFYPSISLETFLVFDCVDLRDIALLRSDPSQQCYTSTWRSWAAVAGISTVVYCVGYWCVPPSVFGADDGRQSWSRQRE